MAIQLLLQGGLICLAFVVGTHGLTVRPSVAQTRPPAATTEMPKQWITTSWDQLSGTVAPDAIKALANHWDGTKLAAPLKLSACSDCPDATTQKTISAAAAVLGALRDIKKSDTVMSQISGPDGGELSISDDGQIKISPAKDIKFKRALYYVVDFERGQAKIAVAVQGTHETREAVMIYLRPVAPAAFAPVMVGKREPWIWERATTW
jgi:hypothetical protein